MPVSINRFSEIATRRDVHGTGVVTLDARQDVRVNRSRFRLVRWIRNSGVGRRVRNRTTVDAFLHSIQHHYGRDVTSRMDLRQLRDIRSRGKPLHVRHIRAAIGEADMVADGVKMVKSSNIGALIEENVAASAYLAFPGGEDLAREVRDRVDVTRVEATLSQNQVYMEDKGRLTGDYSLPTARRLVGLAVRDSTRDVFLSGYGLATGRGVEYGKLQDIVDRHPLARKVKERYGLGFDASGASGALYRALSAKLSDRLGEVVENPGSAAGSGTVKERIDQALRETAGKVVGEFLEERVEALDQLYGMHARGEIKTEDMASYGVDGAFSLARVVLQYRIPPGMLPRLNRMRSETPNDLGDLAAADRTMEHKVSVLARFGGVVEEFLSGLSEEDERSYKSEWDSTLNLLHDCGRFLLEGKVSADAESRIRHAVSADQSGSDVRDLFKGVAGMRGGMYGKDAKAAQWAAAQARLDCMAKASVALLGPDAPAMIEPYTPSAAGVLNAMRNCGLEIPPPGDPRVEHSGKGSFSRPAIEMAEREMQEDLHREGQVESRRYPGFLAEAVEDFSRADFTVDGTSIERGNADAVVDGIRKFCTDDQNNTDGRLCNIVGQLVFQRSNSMALLRFAFGNGTPGDTNTLVKAAPFLGMPAFGTSRSEYSISRNADGNVLVRIRTTGRAKHLNYHDGRQQFLDGDRSRISIEIEIEVDARNCSARVADMRYDYHFVPTDREP